MDHAEVLDRLMDMATLPASLRAFDDDTSPAAAELRRHLASCSACRAEFDAWRDTVRRLDAAVSETSLHDEAPAGSLRALAGPAGLVTLPPGLRDRIVAVAGAPRTPATAAAAPRRRAGGRLAWLAIAAALVLVLAGGYAFVDQTRRLDQARADAASLQAVTAGLELILQDPGHRVALLSTPAGDPAGTVSWSAARSEVVVLADGLSAPPQGQTYRCWIERDGYRVAVGEMGMAGSTAYWVGGLGAWAATFEPGGRFWVSLEPVAGGPGKMVLTGTL